MTWGVIVAGILCSIVAAHVFDSMLPLARRMARWADRLTPRGLREFINIEADVCDFIALYEAHEVTAFSVLRVGAAALFVGVPSNFALGLWIDGTALARRARRGRPPARIGPAITPGGPHVGRVHEAFHLDGDGMLQRSISIGLVAGTVDDATADESGFRLVPLVGVGDQGRGMSVLDSQGNRLPVLSSRDQRRAAFEDLIDELGGGSPDARLLVVMVPRSEDAITVCGVESRLSDEEGRVWRPGRRDTALSISVDLQSRQPASFVFTTGFEAVLGCEVVTEADDDEEATMETVQRGASVAGWSGVNTTHTARLTVVPDDLPFVTELTTAVTSALLIAGGSIFAPHLVGQSSAGEAYVALCVVLPALLVSRVATLGRLSRSLSAMPRQVARITSALAVLSAVVIALDLPSATVRASLGLLAMATAVLVVPLALGCRSLRRSRRRVRESSSGPGPGPATMSPKGVYGRALLRWAGRDTSRE